MGLQLIVQPLHRPGMQVELASLGTTEEQRLPVQLAYEGQHAGEDEPGGHQTSIIIGELPAQSQT
jgi:hypothetical protein